MFHKIIFFNLLLLLASQTFAQKLAMTFQEAEKRGISINSLEKMYKSALHVDSSQAVFKTDAEQERMYNAYIKLMQDFGKFLFAHQFKWEHPTRCFNRIYFNTDGTIDYFLFNFLGKPSEKLAEAKEKEFTELLNAFIKDYQIPLKAKSKFAQCSPSTYMPE